MKFHENILKLYAVTNFSVSDDESCVKEKITAVVDAGVTCVQLREKHSPYNKFLKRALQIKSICNGVGIPFIINDNVKIAIEANSDGVHVGQNDLNPLEVRKLIGKGKIVGVSVQTVEQALKAEQNGADYLGVGAIFPTFTKSDALSVSFKMLKTICNSVSIPVVAIGGINLDNIFGLKYSGVKGVAVSSYIFKSNEISVRTKNL